MGISPLGSAPRRRAPTSTANFGSGRRESHDASAFYARFVGPEISDDDTIGRCDVVDVIHRADARSMRAVASGSVALVVTSPPYFAGKQYEESLGIDGVPATYFEYLELLRAVFAECKRVLEPGGRIAVNVANLGRRPYRSLAADVTGILQDLGLLLRGEVVWWKGRAAGGSCAWGSFQSPVNPVLRDVTERVVIAGKGRFDRALGPARRAARGLPSTATISRDEFMEATTDLWEIAPERATKVGHPAPFPVELPQRLIELYTFEGDVVLDPFMGSGSTAVAAVRTGRHFVGFDTDDDYAAIAEQRVADERARRAETASATPAGSTVAMPAGAPDAHALLAQAVRDGRQTKELAHLVVQMCGFTDVREDVKVRGLGLAIPLVGNDRSGRPWAFDLAGTFTTTRAGLRRSDTLWRALGRAAALHGSDVGMPLVVLTTDAPTRGSTGAAALHAVQGPGRPVFDVVELLNPVDHARLAAHAARGTDSSG